jgi:GntR family transcriptional repressor for pyruvate dehydrogenase complex
MLITKANITQQVIEFLKKNIEDENWVVGEKIPSENQLTEILGVSRASVRMAIQQFIALGALESIHGKGTFVKSNNLLAFSNRANMITSEDYSDISRVLEFRNIIETESCFLAAQRATKESVANLKVYLENMKNSIGQPEKFVKQDMLFHQEICHATGNKLLEKCLGEVFEQTVRNHQQMNEVFGYKDGIYYHTLLVKAIEEKNCKEAKKLMKEHLQQALERLKAE